MPVNVVIIIMPSLAIVMAGARCWVLGDTDSRLRRCIHLSASSLGYVRAIAAGSETTSTMLFYKIQRACTNPAGESGFMSLLASHVAAGANAVTPSKIASSVNTIAAGKEVESIIMRKNLFISLIILVLVAVMAGLIISLGI
jgi:L-lactate permease